MATKRPPRACSYLFCPQMMNCPRNWLERQRYSSESSASELYESSIAKARDLVDRYSTEGIASLGKYLRKAADLVLLQFKSVEKLFETAYVNRLDSLKITPSVERWLREEAQRTIQEQVVRAKSVMESVLCSFAGASPQLTPYMFQLDGEGQAMLKRLDDSIEIIKFTNDGNEQVRISTPHNPPQNATNTPAIFISHSSLDERLAAALVDLLQSALPDLRSGSNRIRCTSVPGYKLEGGAETDTVLREEIRDAAVFIGLLTRRSLGSTYVLFELGARWGLKTKIKPLISGFPKSEITAPLNRLHIQSCDEATDLHQVLTEIAEQLGMPLSGAHIYDRHLRALIEESRNQTSDGQPQIRITSPVDKSKVPHSLYVEGEVSHSNGPVWVIVHPMANPKFWVEPKAANKQKGTWTAQAYIGRTGDADIGYHYELMAVTEPMETLSEGMTLARWPKAKAMSEIVTVERK